MTPDNWFFQVLNYSYGALSYVWLAISTGAASILFFFSVYYILPNRKVPWRPVLRTSIITGLVWLISRFIFAAVLPHLDLKALYGPFYVSVGLLFWAYISGLILFAGAQFSVARWGDKKQERRSSGSSGHFGLARISTDLFPPAVACSLRFVFAALSR